MKFWTAQYPMGGQKDFSLMVQHYEYEGRQICFACITAQGVFCENLYQWFRREALVKLWKPSADVMEKAERSLQRQLRKAEKELEYVESAGAQEISYAGVLCVGDEFIAFERGKMRVWCLNTSFGRTHLEKVVEEEDPAGIYSGRLEEDVALLLVTEGFGSRLGEKWLLDGLFVGEMKLELQMQKRLRELGEEVARNATGDAVAVLVKSCGIKAWEGNYSISGWTENEDVISSGDGMKRLCGTMAGLYGGPSGVAWEDRFRDSSMDSFSLCWEQQLGQGAFSQVYRVKDRKTGEVYACKKSRNMDMLWREYSIGRELEHPLFPKMYAFWQEGGDAFLLMEYVPGRNLKELLEQRGHFGVEQTIRVGMELAEGLLYLHEWRIGCLFRDVKPENIVIRQDGRVKLLDMGCVCAKDGAEASRAGSPGYGAPEQFEPGRVLDVTCDVYAVAKTMEEMLGCAKSVPKGKKHPGIGARTPQKKRLRRKLKDIIRQCTEKDPRRRIPDMRMLLLLLAQLQEKRYKWSLCFGNCAEGKVFYRKKLLCLKNIWERGIKNS